MKSKLHPQKKAAEVAAEIQVDPESIANFYEVREEFSDKSETYEIDWEK